MTVQVNVTEITDQRLRHVLAFLRERNLGRIIVLGGAVRDMLLGRPCRDIDLAVRLSIEAPAALVEHPGMDSVRMTPMLADALRDLSAALGLDVCRLVEAVPVRDVTVDILGLVPVQTTSGDEIPDIFVDSHGRLFGARPELTVNRIGMDANGHIWPDSHVSDLRRRIADFTPAPLRPRLRQVVRALLFCLELDLELSGPAAEALQAWFTQMEEEELLRSDLSDPCVLPLLARIERQPRRGAGIRVAQRYCRTVLDLVHNVPPIPHGPAGS
jgi:hypothetical protein